MRLFLRWQVFLLVCFCACALCASTARSEPLPAGSEPSHPTSGQASNAAQSPDIPNAGDYIVIPGPLRSFERMGAISKKANPDEVIPLLAHFIEAYGYEGSTQKQTRQTEALILFRRYFAQANTLASLAGPDAVIRFSTCEESKPLLAILGYRLRNGCGPKPSIKVDDPEKAFITVDSGFPMAEMEQALYEGKPFSTPYPSVRVPLIYTKRDWTGRADSKDGDLIDVLADHPALARLYWGLSQVNESARDELRKSVGVSNMLPLAPAIDFYGSTLAVRDGRMAVPGGTPAAEAWKRLVGADPGRPGEFMLRLLQKDYGRVAQYYDSVARAPFPQQAYFTSGGRLQRFYAAFRGNDTSADAVRSVFRPSASLLLLVTRLPLGENGEPLVPGDLSVWKEAFRRKATYKIDARQAEKAGGWTSADQLVEGLFALSRAYSTDGPLDMYMTLSEIDRRRPAGAYMSPNTARLLMAHFSKLHDQYEIFSEFAGLNDASIVEFVRMAEKIDQLREPVLRGDAMGTFEANVGLWQILARQGQIPPADQNDSWRRTISSFGAVSNSAQLFDAGRASLQELMKAVTGKPAITQGKIIDLLAGPAQSTSDGRQVHDRMATEIQQVLTDQRLVSLDTLLELGDDFAKMAQNSSEVDLERESELAEELEESRAPRAMFTEAERSEWAPGHEPNRHISLEMKTDLKKLRKGSPPASALAARGALAPFLRDTLVGLNYAYYEPPRAQILHSSPLLVRAHDFLASESVGENDAWLAPRLFGVGQTAGNGTHLSESLAGLPYALAQNEQDFIVPENVQALIWQETSADLLMSSVVPRWWTTSKEALHAAALYQRAGDELIAAGAKDANLQTEITDILSNRLPAETMERVSQELREGRVDEALGRMAPADLFYLTAQFQRQSPGRTIAWGPAGRELADLLQRKPELVNPETLSRDFGVPHPTLAQNYGSEMLNLKPLPSVMNYASELLAESWESTNLYWARLADEMGYSPVMLNELAPTLTRRMVEKIFGSDFDDWPALIRAMRETGEEFRNGQVAGTRR